MLCLGGVRVRPKHAYRVSSHMLLDKTQAPTCFSHQSLGTVKGSSLCRVPLQAWLFYRDAFDVLKQDPVKWSRVASHIPRKRNALPACSPLWPKLTTLLFFLCLWIFLFYICKGNFTIVLPFWVAYFPEQVVSKITHIAPAGYGNWSPRKGIVATLGSMSGTFLLC